MQKNELDTTVTKVDIDPAKIKAYPAKPMDVDVSKEQNKEDNTLIKVKRRGERTSHVFWLTEPEAISLHAQLEKVLRGW